MQAFEDFIDRIREAGSDAELAGLVADRLLDDGFEHFTVTRASPHGRAPAPWQRLPEGFAAAYDSNGWHEVDPILDYARRTVLPFTWKALLEQETLSRPQSAMLDQMRDLGVRSGITLPFHGPFGACSVFSASRATDADLPEERVPIVAATIASAWSRHCQIEQRGGAAQIRLSQRERDCLRWLRFGKSSPEIALILGISRKTVEFHLANVSLKLGVSGRVAIIVSALRLGLV